MQNTMKMAATTAAFAALLAVPNTATAQQRITCESENDRMETCHIRNLDEQSVRLVDRLSSAACVNGRSWGTNRDEIWVDDGCRARFTYETGGSGRRGEVTCESHDGNLKNCRVPGLVQNSVQLERRLSSAACVNGRSWGTLPDVIWVESGCRAEFSYEARGGGNDGGHGWDNNNAGNTPSELRGLIGARASGGEQELQQRGYTFVRTTTVRDSRIAYWRNSRENTCIAVTTTNGEYAAINSQPNSVCR